MLQHRLALRHTKPVPVPKHEAADRGPVCHINGTVMLLLAKANPAVALALRIHHHPTTPQIDRARCRAVLSRACELHKLPPVCPAAQLGLDQVPARCRCPGARFGVQ